MGLGPRPALYLSLPGAGFGGALLAAPPSRLGRLLLGLGFYGLALDRDPKRRLVLLVQANGDLIVPDALDGAAGDLDALPIDVDALLEELVGDIVPRHRSVELAVGSGGKDEDDLLGLDLVLEVGGSGTLRGLDGLDLRLALLEEGQALRVLREG